MKHRTHPQIKKQSIPGPSETSFLDFSHLPGVTNPSRAFYHHGLVLPSEVITD